MLLSSITFCVYSNIKGEIPKTGAALAFKENKGQIGDQFSKPRPDILFSGNSGNLVFHLRNNGISYQMYRVDTWKEKEDEYAITNTDHKAARKVPDQTTIYRLDINWLNANLNAVVLKENAIEGYDNYYNEVSPNGVTDVKSYKNITYQNLYKGIDLKWYEKNGNLKYDYIVAPGFDYQQIQLEIKGANTIFVDKNGELIIKTPLGTLTEKAPYITQEGKVLQAKWIVTKNIVSFDIINIDVTKPLVIDPLVRLWGTYYGGISDEAFFHSDVDASGNIYATGYSDSQNNIATVGAYQTVNAGGPSDDADDAILVKFNSAGVRLWATYYGGNYGDYGRECAIDPTGNYIAMVGGTSTTLTGVIATPGTHQTTYAGNASSWSGDAFLVMFNSAGFRQWGTYYGGPQDEWATGCDFDGNGDIYISGTTLSSVGLSSPGAHQTVGFGSREGFLAKFNNTGTRLWGTFYGDIGWDWVTNCKADPSGNVFITGYSNSKNNIATAESHQPALYGLYGEGDAIIVKFNSSGVRLWGTYYGGGNGNDWTLNCVFDEKGNLYVSGLSASNSETAVTTPGAHQTTFGGNWDAFLLKMTNDGKRVWSTFYGGKGVENNNWVSIDPTGNIYLVGVTNSTSNISSPCAYQTKYAGVGWGTIPPAPVIGGDAYIAKFDPNGKRFWGTYYGGTGFEFDYCSSSIDPLGNIYIVGSTNSYTDNVMSSSGSHQPIYGGGLSDAFIAKFDGCFPSVQNTSNPSNLIICQGDSTSLTTNASCVKWYSVPNSDTAIATTPVFTTPSLFTTTTFYVSDQSCGSTTVQTAITVTVNPLPQVSIDVVPEILCYKTSINAKATGALSYTWFPDQWISCTNCSDPILTPRETMQYCVEGMDNNFCVGKTCKTIEVNFARDHDFSLPNALTPNGDGINDSFCLQGWSICNDNFLIRIFDRWGEKVFESSDPNFCWDGTYNGKSLNADVFVYSVSATYKDDTKVNKKGNITLIR